jgi:hypothetical protein
VWIAYFAAITINSREMGEFGLEHFHFCITLMKGNTGGHIMILFFFGSMVFTACMCVLAYRIFAQKIEQFQLKLDDGRGYYLISMLLVAFVSSALAFFVGSMLGFQANAAQQDSMVLIVLLNAVVALLALIYGLVHFREGERY